jgi:hypothetical protein
MDNTTRIPRYPFAAPAEIIVQSSGVKTLCRVTELSLHGCYVDCSVPIGVKTQVLVKIYGTHDYFEAGANIIYANPRVGIGLVFREVKPAFAPILQKWLLAAMNTRYDDPQGRGE